MTINPVTACLAAVAFLLVLAVSVMWLAVISRANNLDEELQEEDEHLADISTNRSYKADFRGVNDFRD